MDYLEAIAANAGIPIYRVTAGDIGANALNARMREAEYGKLEDGRWASLPLFTKNANGSVGKLKRQCTKEYKLEPIRRQVSRILGEHGLKKTPGIVEQWIGISRDEMSRMRQSDVRYITNRYPLVFELAFTRRDCVAWLEANDFQVPEKSACKFCPFRSNAEWRKMRDEPDEWLQIVQIDKVIRETGGIRGATYLHRDCKPIDDVDLSSPEERGQRNWLNECTGLCGV